jgi:hypothetical protein
MLDLSNVSLICVDSKNPKLAKFAIDQCLKHAIFGECIHLSSKNFELPDYITQVQIPEINNTRDYSQFMMSEVHKYFKLSHALIIQWDGFILSSEGWSDEYLKFDYIGAPWVRRGLVGNGGFSLRSKKLCEVLAKLKIVDPHPEDLVICSVLREKLELQYGIKFAPIDIAKHFAFESNLPEFKTFGFHAVQNFPFLFNDIEIIEIINLGTEAFIKSGHIIKLIRSAYKFNRFDLADAVLRKRMLVTNPQRIEGLILMLRIKFKKIYKRFLKNQ